jgi:hypothetical protein
MTRRSSPSFAVGGVASGKHFKFSIGDNPVPVFMGLDNACKGGDVVVWARWNGARFVTLDAPAVRFGQ